MRTESVFAACEETLDYVSNGSLTIEELDARLKLEEDIGYLVSYLFYASSGKSVGDGEHQRAVAVRNRRNFLQVESKDLC